MYRNSRPNTTTHERCTGLSKFAHLLSKPSYNNPVQVPSSTVLVRESRFKKVYVEHNLEWKKELSK